MVQTIRILKYSVGYILSQRREKFRRIANRAAACGSLTTATRLWEYADHSSNPESYWGILATEYPAAFDNPACTNSLRYTPVRVSFDIDGGLE